MKNLIIFFLLFSAISYSQNKKTIFFKLDNSVATDSIVFQNKKLGEVNNILKFKRRKKIKFSVYKNGKKHDFKISGKSLGFIHTISLTPTSDDKISLSIDSGEIKFYSVINDKCTNDCFKLKILTNFIWNNNGQFETGNKDFDKEINEHPNFFLF